MTEFLQEKDVNDFLKFNYETIFNYKVFQRVGIKGSHLPDIDLLYIDKGNELIAIELKYLKYPIQTKFYLGIDEALALLLYGVDYVYLLHVFDEKTTTIPLTLALLKDIPIGYQISVGRSMPETIKKAPLNPLKTHPIARKNRLYLEKMLQI